ncbi:MAG: DUF47 family protein [Armatimonadetes bacterium]|nr:DUF47 family protein [Armatimonadota bacterium]
MPDHGPNEAQRRRPVLSGFQRILGTLMPKEEDFFVLFQRMADNALEATQVLQSLTEDFSRLDYAVGKIDELEHRGDETVHEVTRRLNATFVTPMLMDREDILHMSELIDDITDHIKAVIDRFRIYDISAATPPCQRVAGLLLQATQLLRDNMYALDGLQPGQNPYCPSINALENEGDVVLREAMGALFRDEADARNIIKWKDIYEMMEEALDNCEDAANLVEALVVKNA